MTAATEAPGILLSYQSESAQIADENQFTLFEKSRRIGLTYGFSPYAVLKASASRGAQNVYYIGYNLDMAREFIGYCADFATAFEEISVSLPDDDDVELVQRRFDGSYLDTKGDVIVDALDEHYHPEQVVREAKGGFLIKGDAGKSIKTFRIDFPSGKSIVALPSSPRSVRGKQGIFIVDEAAFHDNLEELVKAILATLMWGGKVIVISTHDGVDNFFNTLIEDIRGKKRGGKVHRITIKDAIAAGLYKRICLVGGKEWSKAAEEAWEAELRSIYGDAADEELDVIPAHGSGTYLARATIKRAMRADLPVVRMACPKDFEKLEEEERRGWINDFLEAEVYPWIDSFDPTRRTYAGQDFARSGDVSPIMFGQHDEFTNLVTRLTLEMRNVPFSDQEYIVETLFWRVPLFACAKLEGRGNGSALAEKMQQKFGFDRIEAVSATDKVYLKYMPLLKSGITDQTFLLPLDEAVLDDMRMIKEVRGIPKIPDGPKTSKEDGKKAKRHGDTAIAGMHLVAAAEEDIGPIEFMSGGERTSDTGDFETTENGFGTVRRVSNGGYGL
jgi:phage FluMu gp28-like protein